MNARSVPSPTLRRSLWELLVTIVQLWLAVVVAVAAVLLLLAICGVIHLTYEETLLVLAGIAYAAVERRQ